jgi:hypothetical protein
MASNGGTDTQSHGILGSLGIASVVAKAQTHPARAVLIGLGILAIALASLAWLFDVPLPIPFLTTTGRIYVDSPEVYTRERLVNDRYDQDYWLRQQLKILDDREHIQLPVGHERRSMEVAAGASATGSPAEGPGVTSPPGRLSFEQEFRIVGGIRDTIRQQVLENMLDDRHDLSGNSVYGLKFDTTVIPGSNTWQRAFVHVRVGIDDIFERTSVGPSFLPAHISGHILAHGGALPQGEGGDKPNRIASRYGDQDGHYKNWIKDIEKRLNRAEDSVFESMGACPEAQGLAFYDELTRRTLEVVLGIPQEVFSRFNEPTSDDPLPEGGQTQSATTIRLQNPWAKFFSIDRTPFTFPSKPPRPPCRYRVWFDLNELDEQLIALKRDHPETPAPALPAPLQIADSPDGQWTIWVESWENDRRAALFGDTPSEPRYWPTSAAVERLLALKSLRCDQGREPKDECTGLARNEIRLRSGLFNFIEHLSALDAYSYAMFPKNDVVGVLAQTSARVSADTGEAGSLDLARESSGGLTSSVLVGFGDGGGRSLDGKVGPADARSIAFGWVISGQGTMAPVQKSQLALVSVPAWTNTLHLNVSVGWLDREGDPILDHDEAFELDISVPPDYETFDSLFRQDAWINRDPRIQDDEMDKDIYVKAGEGTKILIPGARLWRSASVTLGAQLADRIRVLPNMEGIIAEFGKVDLPYAAYRPDTETQTGDSDQDTLGFGQGGCDKLGDLIGRPVRLRVWTSEGVAKALGEVCVMYNPKVTGDQQDQSRPQRLSWGPVAQ